MAASGVCGPARISHTNVLDEWWLWRKRHDGRERPHALPRTSVSDGEARVSGRTRRFLITPDEDEPETMAEEYRLSREDQDRFALRSHQKAIRAIDEKRSREEIVPVPVKTRKEETLVEVDEGPRRDTSLEKLARLRPAFKKDGTVTAGNSSSLNDGAAAVLVVSAEYAESHGLEPLAKVRSIGVAGVPRVMGIGPVPATQKALERAGISLDDVAWWSSTRPSRRSPWPYCTSGGWTRRTSGSTRMEER